MPLGLLASFAALPLIVAGVLLVVLRVPAKYAMPVAFLTAATVAIFVWDVDPTNVAAASLEGLVTASTLLYIIFGALLLLAVLSATGGMRRIQEGFNSISPDRRVQAIILTWLFGTFLEGASGFGSSAAVTAPIMLAMGFPAMAAVMVGLLVQTAPVTFGAVGTPIVIGVTEGLRGSEKVDQYVAETGTTYSDMVYQISYEVAIYHLLIAVVTPLVISIMLPYFFGEKRSLWRGFDLAPFALYSGVAMLAPYVLCAYFLGPEFPSMFGGLVGLLIVVLTSRRGFLMPKDPFTFPARESWPQRWMGKVSPEAVEQDAPRMSLLRAWTPYIVVAVVIVITRLSSSVQEWFTQDSLPMTVPFESILGTPVSTSAQYLYSPGTALIMGAIAGAVVQKLPVARISSSLKLSVVQTFGAALVLLFTLPLVRIIIRSGAEMNDSGLASMPVVMAEAAAGVAGSNWPLVSPWIGALGAFIAGSNTVSNLTFSLFQFSTGEQIGVDPKAMVVTQAVGGAGGNPIAIHNVVAASATVGLMGREGDLIRKSGVMTIYYCVVGGILGYLVAFGIGLNLGTVLLVVLLIAMVSFVLYARRRPESPQPELVMRTGKAARNE